MKGLFKSLAALLLAVCMVAQLMPMEANANDMTYYSVESAVAYAQKKWNVDDGTVCDQFVKACLKEGGVEILAGDVEPVMNALVDAGFGVKAELTVSPDQYLNRSENPALSLGDVIFFYCTACNDFLHTMIVAGFDENGNAELYGHNPCAKFTSLTQYNHFLDDGVTQHKGTYKYYAVHMTQDAFHAHVFTSDLYEAEHPHKFYAKCSCGTKYYLGWNARVSSCTVCNPPAADVPILTVTAGTDKFELKWTTVYNATGYQVFRAKNVDGPYFSLGVVNATSFTNKDAEIGQTYYFKIKALGVNCESEPVSSRLLSDCSQGHSWDNGVVIKQPTTTAAGTKKFTCTYCGETKEESIPVLSSELILTATVENNKVKLSWNKVENVVGYEVYRARTETGTYTKLNTVTGTTFTNSSVEAGQTYYYKIKAIRDPDTNSVWSNIASCKIQNNDEPEEGLNAPAKPYKAVNVVSGPHIYWKSTAGAVKYGLWRSEDGINGTYKWLANPTVPHFTDLKVQTGKTYYYKVTAMDSNGKHSAMSDAIGIIYVATPDITSRFNKGAGVQVGWNKIEGATGYGIYRKSFAGDDAWVRVATISGNKTFTWIDSSVKNSDGEIYRYTVRALAGSDMKTLSGCRAVGRTMVRLSSRVLNSAAKSGANSIKCNWTTSSVVTGYEVRFMVGNEVYKTVTIGNCNTGSRTFSGLPAGQEYKIQVRAYKKVDGVGSFYSAWSVAKYVKL